MLRAHYETHYTHYLLEYQNSLYLSTLLWWPYLVYHNLFLLRGLCFLGIPDLFPGNGGKQVNRSCHPTVPLKETRLLINAVLWILREWNMSTVESFVRILGNQFWCYVSRDYTFYCTFPIYGTCESLKCTFPWIHLSILRLIFIERIFEMILVEIC